MDKREYRRIASEKGYLLVSTLFFLVFSSLFVQMAIKISGNHVLQLRQFSEAYQAKSALNMSENVLKEYIETTDRMPEQGRIHTSAGEVAIEKTVPGVFLLTVTLSNHIEYSQAVAIDFEENLELEDSMREDPLDEQPEL